MSHGCALVAPPDQNPTPGVCALLRAEMGARRVGRRRATLTSSPCAFPTCNTLETRLVGSPASWVAPVHPPVAVRADAVNRLCGSVHSRLHAYAAGA